jgi:hypothetical protein
VGSNSLDAPSFPTGAAVFGLAILLCVCTLAHALHCRPKPPARAAAHANMDASIEVTGPDGRSHSLKLHPDGGFLIGRGPVGIPVASSR